ncbi:Uncharacterised protein [Mycobacteroides abscessus]|nr:Uncharacterised protein [Mycobacteroides abscessus]
MTGSRQTQMRRACPNLRSTGQQRKRGRRHAVAGRVIQGLDRKRSGTPGSAVIRLPIQLPDPDR